MSDRVFVDTNVLVYAFDDAVLEKKERALAILESSGKDLLIMISTQVLQEFYVTVTRKLERPLGEAEAERAVCELARLPVVQVDVQMVLSAVALSRRHQLSIWDALILRAAIEGGCTRLLTEDLQHGLVLRSLRVENPFLH